MAPTLKVAKIAGICALCSGEIKDMPPYSLVCRECCNKIGTIGKSVESREP